MTIGVILEEPSAEPFVRRIAEWSGVHIEIRISRGKGNLRNKIVSYANELSRNCNKVLAVVDSHCSDPILVEQDFLEASASSTINIHICVVVHALESWLLADSQALARKLRTRRLRTPANPETLCKPEEELDRLFQLHDKQYIKNRDVEKIIELARLSVIAHKCASFERFIGSLRDC